MNNLRPLLDRRKKGISAVLAMVILIALLATAMVAYLTLVSNGDFLANQANQSRQNQVQTENAELLKLEPYAAQNGVSFVAVNRGDVPVTMTAVYVTNAAGDNLSKSSQSPSSQFLVSNPDLSVNLPITVPVGLNTSQINGCGTGCNVEIYNSALTSHNGEIYIHVLTLSGNVFSASYPVNQVTTTTNIISESTTFTSAGSATTATTTFASTSTISCEACTTATTMLGQGTTALTLSLVATASTSPVPNGGTITLTATITNSDPSDPATGVSLLISPTGGITTGTASVTPVCSPATISSIAADGGTGTITCQYTALSGSFGGSVSFSGYAKGTVASMSSTSAEATSNSVLIGYSGNGPWALNYYYYDYESSTQQTPASASYISAGNNHVAYSLQVENTYNQPLTILDESFVENFRTGPDPTFFAINGAPCYTGACANTFTAYNCYMTGQGTCLPEVNPGSSQTLWFAACPPSSSSSSGSSSWSWSSSGGGGGSCGASWSPPEGDTVVVVIFYTIGSGTTIYSQTLPFESEIITQTDSMILTCTPSLVALNVGSTCKATVTGTGSVTPTGLVQFTSSPSSGGSFSPSSCTLAGSGATASCSVTFTPSSPGSYAITASYGGDAHYAPLTAIADVSTSSTLPVQCTMANSAPQTTITLSSSGGTPSPSTVLCDGNAHNITVPSNSTITATEPAAGTYTRDEFLVSGSASTTASTTSCLSGTCPAWTIANYYQVQNTYMATPKGATTWDTSQAFTVSGTYLGAAATACTTPSTTNGGSSVSCSAWTDYNTAASFSPTTISLTNERWQAAAPTSFSPTTGHNTYTVNYYDQFAGVVLQITAKAQPAFDSGLGSLTMTGNVLGSSTTLCMITITGGSTASCSPAWVDANAVVSGFVASLSGAPTNTRWENAAGAASTVAVTSSSTYNVNYYKQLSNTYQASTNGSGPPAWDSGLSAAVTGTQYGTAGMTICTISPTSGTTTTASCSGYADAGTVASEPLTMSGAGANIQWKASGTYSWTDSTGGNTHTGAYYKQLSNTYTATPKAKTTWDVAQIFTVSGTQLGTATTLCTMASTSGSSTSPSCTAWSDYNRAASFSPTTISLTNERWQSAAPTSFTPTTGGNTYMVNYYDQYSFTLAYAVSGGGTGYSAPVLTTTQSGSSYTPTLSTAATAYWLDSGASWQVTNPLGGSGSSERWYSSQTVSGTVSAASPTTAGGSLVFNYQTQYYITFAVSPSGAGTTNPAVGSLWENPGTLSITATAGSGDHFSTWTSSGSITFTSATSASTTATISGSGTITANFMYSPTIATTLSATSVPAGSSVYDTATLTGGSSTAGGTVTYEYFASNTCTGTATTVGSAVTVTNGVVPNSASVQFNAAGSYGWKAVYSGDSADSGATSSCEAMTVTKASPTVTTTLSASSISVGSSAYDTATLSGVTGTAGGTVTYYYYTNGACSAGQTSVNVVTVTSGSVPNSASHTFGSAGSYSWNAVYSGDTNNNGATSGCEPLTVTKATPTISTLLSATTIKAGGSASDSATLSGATSTAGGTVQYEYFASATCSGTATNVGAAVAVTNGVVPNSGSNTFSTAGLYGWEAVYSGDANNNGPVTSACEPLSVLSLTISPTSINAAGNAAARTVTLSTSSAGYSTSTTYSYCVSSSSTTISCVSAVGTFSGTGATGTIPTGKTSVVPPNQAAGTYYVIIYTGTTIWITAALTVTN